MGDAKAIVTIALGEKSHTTWRRVCEANWHAYAQKHGYAMVCIAAPLAPSARARQQSPSWQKCLILGQDSICQYDRVVWVDADILINVNWGEQRALHYPFLLNAGQPGETSASAGAEPAASFLRQEAGVIIEEEALVA